MGIQEQAYYHKAADPSLQRQVYRTVWSGDLEEYENIPAEEPNLL